jgi:hypothetical protein
MRVAGTPEARRAWLMMRLPFLAAYLMLGVVATLAVPVTSTATIWRIVAFIVSLMLVTGSLASLAVVTHTEPKRLWVPLAVLEVTGLRALVAFEVAFAGWNFLVLRYPLTASMAHAMLACFALGILLNMTWVSGWKMRQEAADASSR